MRALTPALRRWDRRAAESADKYIAISTVVRDRVQNAYGITADVMPAPHSVDSAGSLEPVPAIDDWRGSKFFLCVARLLPYKNVDRVVAAFEYLPHARLVIVGTGPEYDRISRALGSNVKLLSDLTDGQMRFLYSEAIAVIAASFEDFGLTPIEAAVYGKPSVTLRYGGFIDTVIEGTTGVFFDHPEPKQIAEAIRRAESGSWDPGAIVASAERFSEKRFHIALREEVARWVRFQDSAAAP